MTQRRWQMEHTPEEWQSAVNLAEQRGCVPENPCWPDCLEMAMEEVEEAKRDRPADE